MEAVDADEEVPDLTKKLRDMQKADRAIMDKAIRAFVSYIRAYGKHECHLLLRIKGEGFTAH
jgi:ATP-dependent RNA helicase DDX55/SPB4